MIERYDDPAAFAALVEPLLLRDEPRYNLELSVLARMARGETYGFGPPLMLTVDGAAALMTPPHQLLLSAVPAAAAEPLAEYLAAEGVAIPGAMAATDVVTRFGDRYAALTGRASRTLRDSGVYALRALIAPAPVPGVLREATYDDRDLVVAWWLAFEAEAAANPEGEAVVERAIADGRMWLWEVDGVAVSQAGCGGYTPTGARIGPVYTPPEHRRRGYASAATAAVTQLLLDRGCAHTFLYTDLANPTSNKIYREIGYEHVTDVRAIAFD